MRFIQFLAAVYAAFMLAPMAANAEEKPADVSPFELDAFICEQANDASESCAYAALAYEYGAKDQAPDPMQAAKYTALACPAKAEGTDGSGCYQLAKGYEEKEPVKRKATILSFYEKACSRDYILACPAKDRILASENPKPVVYSAANENLLGWQRLRTIEGCYVQLFVERKKDDPIDAVRRYEANWNSEDLGQSSLSWNGDCTPKASANGEREVHGRGKLTIELKRADGSGEVRIIYGIMTAGVWDGFVYDEHHAFQSGGAPAENADVKTRMYNMVLGCSLFAGFADGCDPATGPTLYRKTLNKKTFSKPYTLKHVGYDKGSTDRFSAGDYETSVPELKAACEERAQVDACAHYGAALGNGWGIKRDDVLAVQHLKTSCLSVEVNRRGCYGYSILQAAGRGGLPADPAAAYARLAELCAKKGYGLGCTGVGIVGLTHKELQIPSSQLLSALGTACEKSEARACGMLLGNNIDGKPFLEGKDRITAAWRACAMGEAAELSASCTAVSDALAKGELEEKQPYGAIYYALRGCRMGDSQACERVGGQFFN